MNWYLTVMKDFANFSGRSRRKEYWMFVLFNIIFGAAAMALDNLLGIVVAMGYGPIYGLYVLAILVPSIAVAIRRLHDVGKSGWMLLIAFIPLVGAIWLLVLMVMDSQPGENEYGPDPKAETF